jgi:hypothetical protein
LLSSLIFNALITSALIPLSLRGIVQTSNILISYVLFEYVSKVVRQIKEQADENFPKDTKRAVIFQGSGAIGAYAAGLFRAVWIAFHTTLR